MEDITKMAKALCNDTRLKIVKCLLDGEKCVCDIIPHAERAQSTVSLQLAKLVNLGIIEARRDGRSVYYKLANPHIKRLLSMLDFSKWKGINRKRIRWYPVIEKEKCNGCGMCVTSCSRDVFSFDFKINKPWVNHKYNCLVGCNTCSVYCLAGAISFPEPPSYIKGIIRSSNLIVKAQQELMRLKTV